MRFITLLILILAATCQSASAINLSDAPGDTLIDCEVTLTGKLQQGVLHFMFSNISRVIDGNTFAQFYSGALTPALDAFGFRNGHTPVTLEIVPFEDGSYSIKLMSALKHVQTLRVQDDPTMVWRRIDKNVYDASEGSIPLQVTQLFSGEDNDHYHGTKFGSGQNGQRYLIFQPMGAGALRIVLGIDVPCEQIERYLNPEFKPVLVLSAQGQFCRVGVLHADFKLRTEPGPH